MIRHSEAGRMVIGDWEELQKRCNRLRVGRNALAHRRVVTFKIGSAKSQPALVGYKHDIRHALEEEFGIPSHIKIARVKELSKGFVELGRDLLTFANCIQHGEAKP